jgi:hypothetical protein
MLRRLLEERFALRARRETREMPVYLLTRLEEEELGPNLRRAAKDCLPSQMCEGRIRHLREPPTTDALCTSRAGIGVIHMLPARPLEIDAHSAMPMGIAVRQPLK